MVSRKLTSKEDDARYCQTCGHAHCSAIADVGEHAPALIPTGSADETPPVQILDCGLELPVASPGYRTPICSMMWSATEGNLAAIIFKESPMMPRKRRVPSFPRYVDPILSCALADFRRQTQLSLWAVPGVPPNNLSMVLFMLSSYLLAYSSGTDAITDPFLWRSLAAFPPGSSQLLGSECMPNTFGTGVPCEVFCRQRASCSSRHTFHISYEHPPRSWV